MPFINKFKIIKYNYLKSKTKKGLVLKLLQEDYNYREIQKRFKVSPGFITKVKKELFGDNYVFTNET